MYIKTCKYCGKIFGASSISRNYCSQRCSNLDSKKPIYGRGINDSKEPVKINGKHINSYKAWRSMFGRCYAHNDIPHIRAYKDVEVCKEWWSFSKFLEWYNEHYIEGNVLDKDICNKTKEKCYCPQNCAFVPQGINNLISDGGVKGSKYPRGISKPKGNKRFQVIIGAHNGKSKKIGLFDTMQEAQQAYKKSKEAYIKQVAQEYYDKGLIERRVYDALMNWKININD